MLQCSIRLKVFAFHHCFYYEDNKELRHCRVSGLLRSVRVRCNQKNYFGELHHSPDTERTFILVPPWCTNVVRQFVTVCVCVLVCRCVCLISAHLLLTKFEGDSGKKPHVSLVLPGVSFSFSPPLSSLHILFLIYLHLPLSLFFLVFFFYFCPSLSSSGPDLLTNLSAEKDYISFNCSNCVTPNKSPDGKQTIYQLVLWLNMWGSVCVCAYLLVSRS